jgi:probable rRNA maturation factor
VPIDVFAADEQHERPVEVGRWTTLARQVLGARRVRGHAEVSLLFVDRQAMASLNERFLESQGPTDVLAFPIEDQPVSGRSPDSGGPGPGGNDLEGEPPLLLGDVVICPAVAAENAAEHEVAYEDEVALLVVHGLLHLLGMDHEADKDAEAMEALERQLLQRYYAAPASDGKFRSMLAGRRRQAEPGGSDRGGLATEGTERGARRAPPPDDAAGP